MDIGMLRSSILSEMQFTEEQRIYDYVFLCFFLGNDFLPHFPALNIRTHGIITLLEIYSMVFRKNPDKFLTKGNSTDQPKIEWKNVKLYMKELVKYEHQYIIEEYFCRDKYDQWKWNDEIGEKTTKEQRDKILQNLPIIYRKEERYISPSDNGWEERYYKSLFHGNSHDIKQHICTNYLEGLEWVYMYYSGKGFDWRWSYDYNYPPLIKDLYMHIPTGNVRFINQRRDFYPQKLQLAYVLPKSQATLLPNDILEIIHEKYPQLYSEEPYAFQWAFCRYFWESHVCFPEINMDILEKNIR
jgi:5'-3' exonuclease